VVPLVVRPVIMSPLRLLFMVCVVAFTAAAAAVDLRTKRLPNSLTVPALVAALLFSLIAGWTRQQGLYGAGQYLLGALAGFAVGFGILWVLWMIGGSGGGDVKFLGALGAWLGAGSIVEVLIVSAVLSLMLTLLTLAIQFVRLGPGGAKRRYLTPRREDKKNRRSDELAEHLRQKQMVRRRLVPFGVPVALATWIVLAVQLIVHPAGPQAWGLM